MKKKTICLLLGLLLLLSGCGSGKQTPRKYTVITTVFPLYDWAREIIGDRDTIDLIYLGESGVDLHSYQVAAADMVTISGCDLFLYIGGESDKWVEEVLAAVPNPNRTEMSLMDAIADFLREEEEVEGMQVRPSLQEEEPEFDEHIWLSLRNASAACEAIRDGLCVLDAANAESYTANCAAYQENLRSLDESFVGVVHEKDTLLFCDRFPFRYLVEDYGLNYYAAFSGCSGDSEASFATVLFLAEKADSLGLNVLLQLESADGQLARTVSGCMAAKPKILTMDSMQAVGRKQLDAGYTYLSTMEENLLVLRQALQ